MEESLGIKVGFGGFDTDGFCHSEFLKFHAAFLKYKHN